MVLVRDGVVDDLEALREVFRDASLSNAGDRAALLAHPQVLVWGGESLAEGRTRVAVAEDGRLAGFATFEPAGAAWDLEDLFVAPALMRHGVGRRLIEDLRQLGRARGIGTITVTANPHANAFYTAVGFVHDSVTQTQFGPATRMRLDLGTPATTRPSSEP